MLFASEKIDSLTQLFNTSQNDSTKLAVNNQIIWQYLFTNKDEAYKHIKISERIGKKEGQAYGYVSLLGMEGIYFDVNGDRDSSEFYFQKFLAESKEHNFLEHELNALNNLGLFYWNQGQLDTALTYLFEALKRGGLELKAELTPQEKRALATFYNNIGLIYQEMEVFPTAIIYHQKALNLRNDVQYTLGKLDSYDNLSICYLALNDDEKANLTITEGLKLSEATEGKPNYYHFIELKATLAGNNQDYNKAKELLLSSLNRPKSYPFNQREKLNVYNHLTETCYQLKELDEAHVFLNKAFEIIDSVDVEKSLVAQCYKLKSLLLLQEGDLKGAEVAMDAFYTVTVEKFKSENAEAIQKLKIAYESEKQEKQLVLSAIELENKNNLITRYILISSLVFVFIVGLSIILYFRYKSVKREKEVEALQNQIKLKDSLEAQRRNISRELHDNVGSHLTYIVSSLHDLNEHPSQHTEKQLEDLEEFTRKSILELRDTIWAIRKEAFSLDELQERIVGYVSHFNSISDQLNIAVNSKVEQAEENQLRFEPEEGVHILRIVQEATNNAIKHAKATHIQIQISLHSHALSISISDDGNGFNPEEHTFSFGIKNMQARANEIGATISINSSEHGSSVTLKLNTNDK